MSTSERSRIRSRPGARAGLLLAAALAVGSGCDGRAKRGGGLEALTGPALLEIDLTRGAPEELAGSLFGPAPNRSHADLVEAIRGIPSDAKGVFVRLGMASFGLARGEEIGRLLFEVRDRGTPVVCHAHEIDNSTLMLASLGCSEVWLSPAGQVEAVGIAAQLLFARSLLEKFNVRADFVQVGKYKGAEETFTRDEPSPEARESLEGTLRGMRAAWVAAVIEGRERPALAELLEDGPYTADVAKEHGLIDQIGFETDALSEIKKKAGANRVESAFGGPSSPEGIAEIFRTLGGGASLGTPRVAVVRAVGGISMSSGPSLFGGDAGITEKALGKVIQRLADDDSVEAVVLRIDSPGGSALASDLLWQKLMELREDKPLVVSVGSMAASGGYYLACAANKIVAEPGSIVGSIGVVGGKFSVGEALEGVGVHVETIAATDDPEKAARAGYLSPFDPWDEPTKKKVRAGIVSIYDLFLDRIAEGRGLEIPKVETFAEGRIFSGTEAKERGMIDELGGLTDAIRVARDLASLPEDAPVEIVGGAPALAELFGVEETGASIEELLGERARDAVNPVAPFLREAPSEVLMMLAAAAPLASGESTLAAMPYAVIVR